GSTRNHWQGEARDDPRAVTQLAFNAYDTSHFVDQALADGESESCAVIADFGVLLDERFEQGRQGLARDADACIADRELDPLVPPFLRRGFHLEPDMALPGEAHGIRNDVVEHLLETQGINQMHRRNGWRDRGLQYDPIAVRHGGEHACDFVYDLA